MTGWEFFGWCVAVGVGVPIAAFGVAIGGAIVVVLADAWWTS